MNLKNKPIAACISSINSAMLLILKQLIDTNILSLKWRHIAKYQKEKKTTLQ